MINSYSVFSSLENLRGIVRQAKVRKWEQISRFFTLVIQVEKRTVRQRFFSNKVALFHFLLLHITVGTCCGADFGECSCPKDMELRCENPQLAYHRTQPCNMYFVMVMLFFFLLSNSQNVKPK